MLLCAVAEPIRLYLRGRADTIHELVCMVTSSGEGGGEPSLLEEVSVRGVSGGREERVGWEQDLHG